MQEESTMDKKSSSRSSVPTANKPGGVDTKVKDGSCSGRFPRSGRRREATPHRSEPSPNKPIYQKPKVFDKRPRTAGGFNNDSNWGQVAKAPYAEVGSALQKGSKKQNLNYLLNFTYTPVESSHFQYHGGARNNRGKWNVPRKHKYNKEEFLQANCQFVVHSFGDYTHHAADPDRLVDWTCIEQVRLLSHEVPSCPVCLYPPVAAKITRCGHVFCWSCMLHYLALSDKTWRKCPICFESVHRNDLKSVVAQVVPKHEVGELVQMVLMKKEKGSVIALPRLQWKPTNGRPVSVDQRDIDIRFSKLLVCTPMQVLEKIVQKEKEELEAAYESDKDYPEACFIQTALELLKEREVRIMDQRAVDMTEMMANLVTEDNVTEAVCAGVQQKEDNVERKFYVSAFSDEEEEESTFSPDLMIEDISDEVPVFDEMDSDVTAAIASKPGSCEVNGGFCKNDTKDCFYFYQASDGQQLYLTSLNVRMLVQEYGSLENAPDTFTARIVEKESLTMHVDWRKRLRYLEHLPLTCEFEVVELELKPPLLSGKTLELFTEEIEKRKQRRQRRARDERRHNRRAKEQENKTWGKYPSARIYLDNYNQFPHCGPSSSDTNSWPTPTDMDEHSRLISPATSVGSLNPPSPVCGTPDNNGVRSFAQMLREGKAKPDPFPALTSVSSDTIMEDGESLAAPSYNHSFSDALQTAVDKAEATRSEEPSRSGQKKKKGKKTLLFTTNMARGK